MATTNYVALISGVVDTLKTSAYLSGTVANTSMYYGGPEQAAFLTFPCITVELDSSVETDIAMPARKELASTVVVTAYDNSPDYITGLQSVQNITQRVDDALQGGYTVGGQAIYSQVANRKFGPAEYDNIPLMACRMNYVVRTRFVRAT